ncbi:hypothetical protein BDW68DRAFT_180876 [Aspergillus falconensis]
MDSPQARAQLQREPTSAARRHITRREAAAVATTPSSSTSRTANCNTPADDSVADYTIVHKTPTPATCPYAGATFVIRHARTGRVVSLQNGILALHKADKAHDGGSHWRCVQSEDMWLGFKNAVSTGYIGKKACGMCLYSVDRQLTACAMLHFDREKFCVRQHPNGGHLILLKYESEFRPICAGGAREKELVVGSKGAKGSLWDFIKV